MKYEDLKILDQLREKGSITEEEYQREKAKILNETTSSSTSSGSKPLFGLEENTYLMLMHVSQLLGLWRPCSCGLSIRTSTPTWIFTEKIY